MNRHLKKKFKKILSVLARLKQFKIYLYSLHKTLSNYYDYVVNFSPPYPTATLGEFPSSTTQPNSTHTIVQGFWGEPAVVNVSEYQRFRVASYDFPRQGKLLQAPVTLGLWPRPRLAASKSPAPSVPQLRCGSWLPPLPSHRQDPHRRGLQDLTAASQLLSLSGYSLPCARPAYI